jgi:alkanesulfonate monooxygenase SsuD/methylene tetrahydromethanopterin reductase-like flavin-dependent oxidoreductase (luciferase family)
MLPNHNPLVVAEQALMLEALAPGRIDLGIGASLAFTSGIRKALGRTVLHGPFGSEPYLVGERRRRGRGHSRPCEAAAAPRGLGADMVRAAVARWYRTAITGTPDQVAGEVERLLARTGAVELMATTSTYDRDDLAAADAALAALQDG